MDNNLALVPITVWCQTGGKPLAEPKITKDCVNTVKVSERSTVYSEYGWIFSTSEDFNGHGIITRNEEVDPRLISEQNMHHHWIKSYWFKCYESRLYLCSTQTCIVPIFPAVLWLQVICWSEDLWQILTLFGIFSYDTYFPQWHDILHPHPMTCGFPSQMASNVKSVSILWHHHVALFQKHAHIKTKVL